LLSAEFRTVKQGASSITDFCRRLETMAASLREFGDPVGDRTLVLTLLRGLSEKFCHVRTNIKLRQPFPTFAEARTILLLEEIDLNDFAGDTGAPPVATSRLQQRRLPRLDTRTIQHHCPYCCCIFHHPMASSSRSCRS
jgi:hypothetical protein